MQNELLELTDMCNIQYGLPKAVFTGGSHGSRVKHISCQWSATPGYPGFQDFEKTHWMVLSQELIQLIISVIIMSLYVLTKIHCLKLQGQTEVQLW